MGVIVYFTTAALVHCYLPLFEKIRFDVHTTLLKVLLLALNAPLAIKLKNITTRIFGSITYLSGFFINNTLLCYYIVYINVIIVYAHQIATMRELIDSEFQLAGNADSGMMSAYIDSVRRTCISHCIICHAIGQLSFRFSVTDTT